MQKNWSKSLRESMEKRLKKYSHRKKKRTKRYSQGNYQRGLQLKYCGDGQTRNMKGKGRKDGKRTGDDEKIPWDEET